MAGEMAMEVSSTNGNFKDDCSHHDLPNGGFVVCNGAKTVVVGEGIENGNGKVDARRDYVHANGSRGVHEIGDNDENCAKVNCRGDSGDLKANKEIRNGEAKVNGCNGHCEFENNKSLSHENGNCEKQEKGVLVEEKVVKGLEKSCPLEEVEELMNSAESVVPGEIDGDEKVELEQLLANMEVLSDQEESIEEVAESQAVSSDSIEPVGEATVLPVNVECTNELVELVPESHKDASGSDDAEESSKVTEQLPLPMEYAPDVDTEVPDFQTTVGVGTLHPSPVLVVDMPVDMESTSGKISGSQPVGHFDAVAEVGKENTVLSSEQLCEDQISGLVESDDAAPKLAAGHNKELVPEKEESLSINKDGVDVSCQLSANTKEVEARECDEFKADDTSIDVEHQESVEVPAESFTIGQTEVVGWDHDPIAEPSSCPVSSNMETASVLSPSHDGENLENGPPAPEGVSITEEAGDSDPAILDTKENDIAPQNVETSPSQANCINVSVESAADHPTSEKNIVILHTDGADSVVEVGAKEYPSLSDETSANQFPTDSPKRRICFGSFSHEELSCVHSARSTEVKSATDAATVDLSPDSESPQSDGGAKPTSASAGFVDGIPQHNEAPPQECSGDAVAEVCPLIPEVTTRFFNYLVRLPRFDGENLTVQVNEAQAQLNEKTRVRDAINAEYQKIKETRLGFTEEIEAAAAEERAARDSFKSKKDEIDKLLHVQSRAKGAMCIDDIDSRIRGMEHRIEHETLALKEEKQLLREIKLLKLDREQQVSRLGKLDDDLTEALEQQELNEERLKDLRKELNLLRGNVSIAEAVTKAAKKRQYDMYEKFRELQEQLRAANAVRQEAFVHLQSLKRQRYEKTQSFYKYREDAMISSDLGVKGDRNGVSQFCVKQVEEFMELWHNNVEFRNDYIKCSLRGTLRRLGTKDGRSIGMDEQPPVIPPYPSNRIVKENTAASFPRLEQAKAPAAPDSAPVEDVPSNDNPLVKPVEQKKQNSKAKVSEKPSRAVVLASEEALEDDEATALPEEPKPTKEEEERARKEEELRKEEEAIRLKEQRRLEEKAKAESAIERKRRNAEKALAKAAAKAQKETEEKEKAREKRLKKKERKKAARSAPDAADKAIEGEEPTEAIQTPCESRNEPDTLEKVETVAKRAQKPTRFTKPAKVKSTIPPPLRNRGKRKMQAWMWVLIVAVLVLALFLVGNRIKLF